MDYRDFSNDDTDKLWQAALCETGSAALFHHGDERIDLRSISISKLEKKKEGDLIETAKAFIPVALEIGVVAAAAAINVHNLS